MTTDAGSGRRPHTVPQGRIELAAVTLVDGDRPILADVSLDLEAGSTTHVLGCSPDEQSALLRLLLGDERPSDGSVRIDGTDPAELPLATAREQVAIVLSDPWLTAGTIADNIAFGHRGVPRDQISQAARLANVDTFAAGMSDGLDTRVSEQAPELTVGQRRLVALARAVVRQPAVLLIQEPTKGLDAQEETLVIKALQRASDGRTTVVAAERLHYARRPDRQLRLVRGRLVGDPAAPHDRSIAPATDRVRRRAPRRHDVTRSVGGALPYTPLTRPPGPPGPPGCLDDFEPVRLVERSSYTETWEAWTDDEGHAEPRRVLLKTPRRTPVTQAAREELDREYTVARSLRHPGLARPEWAAPRAPLPHTVYGHTTGNTLAELIHLQGRTLSRSLLLRVGYEVARTLSYIHCRGYVHLDLRPEIIVVGRHGAVITDLKMTRPAGTPSRRIYRRGQFGVLPTEQLRGAVADPSMDAYALGVVLYQAVTGTVVDTSDRGFRPPEPIDPSVGLGPAPIEGPSTSPLRSALIRADGLLTELIERLTAENPDWRPTTEEVMATLRPEMQALRQTRPALPEALRGPLPALTGAPAPVGAD